MRVADHREQRLRRCSRAVDDPVALKILWRQCSEFACANIMSSTSVGSRPSVRKLVEQVVDLVGRQRETELARSPPPAPRGRCRERPAAAASAARARRAAPPRRSSNSAISVMRSSSTGASAPAARAPSGCAGRDRESDAALDALARQSSPHTCAMSVALLDQGEIVPARGTTSRALAVGAREARGSSSRGP